MPEKTKHRAAASRSGKSIDRRKVKQRKRRQGSNGTKKAGPKIIGDSIFAVTFQPQVGMAVQSKTKGNSRKVYSYDQGEDYEQMYHDLLKCVQVGVQLVTGEETKFDPLKSGLDLATSLTYVINLFESTILPKDFEYNVDRGEGCKEGYYFSIYRWAPFDNYWHAFEIKSIVQYLRTHDKKMHDLFLLVIKSFKECSNLPTWWDGGYGYAEYMFEENIDDWEDRFGDDEESLEKLDEAIDTYMNYEVGEAYHYKEHIKSLPFIEPKRLLDRLSKLDQKNKIVQWMQQALHFAMLPASIDTFVYAEGERDGIEGLKFDQQACIIWDWEDMYTAEQMECIDSEAQGCGVIDPCLIYRLTPHTKRFDLNEIFNLLQWPVDLNALFRSQRELIDNLNSLSNAKR